MGGKVLFWVAVVCIAFTIVYSEAGCAPPPPEKCTHGPGWQLECK